MATTNTCVDRKTADAAYRARKCIICGRRLLNIEYIAHLVDHDTAPARAALARLLEAEQ